MIRLHVRASIFEVRLEVSLAPNSVKIGTANLEQVWKGWAHWYDNCGSHCPTMSLGKSTRVATQTLTICFLFFFLLQLNLMFQNSEFSLANLAIEIKSRCVNDIFYELKGNRGTTRVCEFPLLISRNEEHIYLTVGCKTKGRTAHNKTTTQDKTEDTGKPETHSATLHSQCNKSNFRRVAVLT